MSIIEKIGAEELILDPTQTYQKCGIEVSALTAHSLMVNPTGDNWINFYDWLVSLHLTIRYLVLKAVNDTIEITWKGESNVLIYIDGKAGVHPTGTNTHTHLVGRGVHTVDVKVVGEEHGLHGKIEVKGTAPATQMDMTVTNVTTTAFTITMNNYDEAYVSINGGAKELRPKTFTVGNLQPNTKVPVQFYDKYGNKIGLFTIATDTANYQVLPPYIPANQTFTFNENDEVGIKLAKVTVDSHGLPIIAAHIDKTSTATAPYFDLTVDGYLIATKPLDFETLDTTLWKDVTPTTRQATARVIFTTSAGTSANWVTIKITDVLETAPDIPMSQTFDITENLVAPLGTVVGNIIINDNGSPITSVNLSGAPSPYLMIKNNGDIVSTGVPADFEGLDPNIWRPTTPTGVGSERIEAPLSVVATNANGSVTRTVMIRVVNMPDTAPKIDLTNPLEVTIAENQTTGTYVTRIPVSDDRSAITAQGFTGGLETYLLVDANGNVTINAPADFETLDATWKKDTDNKTATKSGTVSFTNANGTTTAPITLTIKDVYDSAPIVNDLTIDVIENTVLGSKAGVVGFTSDSPITGVLLDTPLNDWLSIATDGTLTTKKVPDFENMPNPFTLVDGRMIAQSGVHISNAYGTGNATVVLRVTDIADVPASIPQHQIVSIQESKPIGQYITKLSYTVGDNILQSLSIGAPADEYFTIDNQGNITLKAIPDFENLQPAWAKTPDLTKATANAPVTMTLDNGKTVTELVAFDIINVADEVPYIQPDQTFGIAENQPADTTLGTLVFNDRGNKVTSAFFSSPANSMFKIGTDGVISSVAPFDWEALDTAVFTLDGEYKYLTTTITMVNSIGAFSIPVRLQVSNVLDDKPATNLPAQAISTFENFPAGTKFSTLQFTDSGSPITSIVIEDADVASIVNIAPNGDISYKVSPDYEALSTTWTKNNGTARKVSNVKVSNQYGSIDIALEVSIKDIVEIAKPSINVSQAAMTTTFEPAFPPLYLEGGGNSSMAIPLSINNSAITAVTFVENAGGGMPTITVAPDNKTLNITMPNDIHLEGGAPAGWTMSPDKAFAYFDTHISITNGAGTTIEPITLKIAGNPYSQTGFENAIIIGLTGYENIRAVTSMKDAFRDKTDVWIPFMEFNRFDTRHITTTEHAFTNSSFTGSVANMDFGNNTNFSYMFSGSTSKFNQPISNWTIGDGADLTGMLSFNPVFNSSVDGLHTEKVKYFSGMFVGATAFKQPLTSFSFASMIKCEQMFLNATVFDQNITHLVPVIGVWDNNKTDFHTGSALTQVNVSNYLW